MGFVFPECLGCGTTVPESATYCGKCSRAIKAHQTAQANKDELDRQAKAKQEAAKDWPIEERGDAPGQWYDEWAKAEFPLLSAEEQEAVAKRTKGHDWLAGMKAKRRVSESMRRKR